MATLAATAPVEADDPDDLWPIIRDGLEREGDFAAREHLAAGFAIYYSEETTPDDVVIKQHPDGRRELVRFDRDGEHVVQAIA